MSENIQWEQGRQLQEVQSQIVDIMEGYQGYSGHKVIIGSVDGDGYITPREG
jgi:hypothetical protein